MKDLIKALQIFSKYMIDVENPTHCEHDELFVMCDPDLVSLEDKVRLEELSFTATNDGSFSSFRFGSA
jgi:DNA-binding protein YbaB